MKPPILVIDDNPQMASLLQLMLGLCGFGPIVAATSTRDGLEMVQSASPALVLTDWNMAGGGGHRVVTEIRARGDALANVPIIVVSGIEDDSIRSQALEAGADAFIGKPVSLRVLAESLHKHLRHQCR